MGTFFDNFERRRSLGPHTVLTSAISDLTTRSAQILDYPRIMDPQKVNAVFPSPAGCTRQASAAAADAGYSCEFGSSKYYALCGLGGVLSCGLTHTAVTPLGFSNNWACLSPAIIMIATFGAYTVRHPLRK